MKRRITLYIAGRRADLSDDAFVLLNVALNDVTNPAVVRNSWTQEVDLPRTPDNDKLFGASFRLDRNAGAGGSGPDFNASRRVPFSIYAETGEVLFAGYAKLGSVTRDAYRVSLYGGLGDFLYGLAYGSDGEKRSLASLDYGEDLDFDITAQTVAEAWARLGGDTSKPARWDVINFAPCYNGIPDDFNANKALVDPSVLLLAIPHTMDGVPCTASRGGGQALLNLTKELDEWKAHDLRSYLQRPVISVRKLLDAIADPGNNGGWLVDISSLAVIPQLDSWLTRPLLPSLGTYKSTPVSGVTAALNPLGWSATNPFGQFVVTGAPVGGELQVSTKFTFGLMCPGATAATMLPWYAITGGTVNQVLFCQAVAYDSGGNKVAAGSVKSFYHSYAAASPEDVAAAVGYTPDSLNTAFDSPAGESRYTLDTGGRYLRDRDIELSVSGVNIARVDLVIKPFVATFLSGGAIVAGPAGGVLYDGGTAYAPTLAAVPTGTASVTGATADSLRSGAHITKEMLLSTSATPAEYLVSLCKMLGLYIVADGAAKTVRILTRADFFQAGAVDITKRVDAPSVEIRPLAFDAKWYEWKHPSVGGRFEKQYQDTDGVQYGIQRVDTGYDFDAQEKDVLAGSAIKSCASVQDRGPWWLYAYDIGLAQSWFGPLMTPGTEFTLWDADGKDHQELATSPTTGAAVAPYNPAFPGYDVADRAEFRNADDKALDGADVLLFYQGTQTVDDFNLTDDLPAMDTLLGGPCWILDVNNVGLAIPHFSRYRCLVSLDGKPTVVASLDFGIPREVDIPGLVYTTGTIYIQAWRQYIADRLSVHGKVMRCRMVLDGLHVGPELLRRFYWYQGSLWALVSVSNYSLTTFDPAECEFVQVRDTNAYI